jgi:ATP-binding cassette, subfamily B, bacterial
MGARLSSGLTASLQENVRRVLQLGRAVGLVWSASPGWTVANAALIALKAALPLVFLYVLKLLIDALAQKFTGGAADESLNERVVLLVGIAAGTALLQSLAVAAGRLIIDTQSQVITDHVATLLHQKSIEVDLEYYEQPKYHDTLHRAQQQATYRPRRIVDRLLDVGQNGMSLAVMGAILVSFHWAILPVLALASIPGVILRMRHSAQYYDWERRATAEERLASYYNEILNSVGHAKDIRLFGLGPLFRERFVALRRKLRQQRTRLVWSRASGDFIGDGVAVAGMFAVFAAMVHSVTAGAITVGSLVMYFTALQRAWSHVGAMLHSTSELYEDNLFLGELYEFLDLQPRVLEPAAPLPVPTSIATGLAVENVGFRYPNNGRQVLTDISLRIRPGEHVALVGHNGSGKTTLAKLLCRLYDVSDGAITLDGTDIRRFRIRDYRDRLGVLVQDYPHYQQTARENVWFGNTALSPTDPRIEDAARASGADAVFARLEGGYDAMLGNRFRNGEELSGGQWQKVALARIFVRDCPILILDEPTSALDPDAEEEVLARFRELARGRTTILISHRLSAVKDVDTIYVLEQGRIAEAGAHAELMRRGGVYARLFELQAKNYRA